MLYVGPFGTGRKEAKARAVEAKGEQSIMTEESRARNIMDTICKNCNKYRAKGIHLRLGRCLGFRLCFVWLWNVPACLPVRKVTTLALPWLKYFMALYVVFDHQGYIPE
jgi:hypothetical protein